MARGPIEVVGLRELRAAARRAADTDLPRRMGQANRTIGELVISRLQPAPDPAAIGVGAGATVRPSASKRDVLLRTGGAHRRGKTPRMQWGKRRVVGVGRRTPPRPYIRATADRHRSEIERAYLQAVADAMRPAFHRTEP